MKFFDLTSLEWDTGIFTIQIDSGILMGSFGSCHKGSKRMCNENAVVESQVFQILMWVAFMNFFDRMCFK